jgi:hypothetical protein
MSDIDVRRQHATWLALIESSGPFLTLPVLTSTLSQGLERVHKTDMDALRLAWATWEAEQHGNKNEAAQTEWVQHVVRDLLDWHDDADFDPPPGKWEHTEPEYDTLTAAAFTLGDPDAGSPTILGFTVQPGTSLTARSTDGWSASPLDRVAVTLREHDIPLGLLTDGRWWGLVWAPRGGATAHALWDSVLWIEDRVTLEAFTTLLGRRRSLGVAESNTLLGMLKASLDSQEEVTDQLGKQVRRAVETLVDSISRADEDTRQRHGDAAGYLDGVTSDTVYEAAVTVLMRLVFMLAAEERRLLPIDDDLYAKSYGIATLGDELDLRAVDQGEDALDHGVGAWQRLLAAFRVVHDGADHHDFRLPGYGGGLFDPDRYAWLEGRTVDGRLLPPLPVDDRTVRRVVRSLMWLEFRDKGVRENRRVTYRALDVEQIGYVYEGLLDHGAVRADLWTLGFDGPNEPEISLDELASQTAALGEGFLAWLAKQLGKPAKWIGQRLGEPTGVEDRDETWRRVLAACGNDEGQASRVLPFARHLRDDQRGLPIVIPPGRIYVTASSARSDTGTHYTPRSLAESVVAGALEPLVYSTGPLQTLDRAQWRIVPPEQILGLRVADIAMGSGAFLVAADRYLADRLIEAVLAADPDAIKDPEAITLWFLLHDQDVGADTADEEADEALIHARRMIVERCLYGADINPLAVEMAKLSLWLITSAQHRPFSFLDHRLVAGDSLLGLTSLAQLEDLHVVPVRGRELHKDTLLDETAHVRRRLGEAADSRREIALRPSTDLREVEFKAARLAAADRMLADLDLLANGLSAAGIAGARQGEAQVDARTIRVAGFAPALLGAVPGSPEHRRAVDSLTPLVRDWLQTDRPAHVAPRSAVQWLTCFPEVFLGTDQPGFDAVIGNPPFLGGTKITGANGVAYREHLVRHVGRDVRAARADLVAYFFLVADEALSAKGEIGLIATNSIAQGDSREASLDLLVADGRDIRACIRTAKWPTRGASLEYSVIWLSKRQRDAGVPAIVDGTAVDRIGSDLLPGSRVSGAAHRLVSNQGLSFSGCKLTGMGFTLTPAEAATMIAADARNAEVLAPLLNGDDLNSAIVPDQAPSRWVIDFNDRSEEAAASYTLPFETVERLVKPERQRRKSDGEYVLRKPLPQRWWQFADKRPALRLALQGLDRALVLTQTSNVLMPLMVPTGWVVSHACIVFATDDFADLALLSSAPHYWWAVARSSTMRTDVRYTPSDVFETLARPLSTAATRGAGQALHDERQRFMLARNLGLTKSYSLIHDRGCQDEDARRLRQRHVEVDNAVLAAYGWEDLPLQHDHWETRQGMRWSISPAAQVELLDRLLARNHERHAAEEAVRATIGGGTKLSAPARTQESTLFDEEIL